MKNKKTNAETKGGTEGLGYLNNRHLSAKHENSTHLKQHPEGVPYVVGAEFLEALGAVPTLQQERLPHGGLRQPLLQAPRLSGEHDRRERLHGLQHLLQLILVRIFRKLQRLLALPAVNAPLSRGGGGAGGCGSGGGGGGGAFGRVGGVDG